MSRRTDPAFSTTRPSPTEGPAAQAARSWAATEEARREGTSARRPDGDTEWTATLPPWLSFPPDSLEVRQRGATVVFETSRASLDPTLAVGLALVSLLGLPLVLMFWGNPVVLVLGVAFGAFMVFRLRRKGHALVMKLVHGRLKQRGAPRSVGLDAVEAFEIAEPSSATGSAWRRRDGPRLMARLSNGSERQVFGPVRDVRTLHWLKPYLEHLAGLSPSEDAVLAEVSRRTSEGHDDRGRCRSCGAALQIDDLAHNVGIVRCGYCGTVTWVGATAAQQAAPRRYAKTELAHLVRLVSPTPLHPVRWVIVVSSLLAAIPATQHGGTWLVERLTGDGRVENHVWLLIAPALGLVAFSLFVASARRSPKITPWGVEWQLHPIPVPGSKILGMPRESIHSIVLRRVRPGLAALGTLQAPLGRFLGLQTGLDWVHQVEIVDRNGRVRLLAQDMGDAREAHEIAEAASRVLGKPWQSAVRED